MGTIIHKNAAATDILADVSTALGKARTRGGVWAKEGDRWLAEVSTLSDRNTTEATTVATQVATAVTVRDLALTSAHDTVARCYDLAWNAVGRPGHDASLAILFPGGADCADGAMDGRPATMDAIADVLESLGHPRIDSLLTAGWAGEIRASAAALRTELTAVSTATARQAVKGKVMIALARVGQSQLVSFKRTMLAHKYGEVEIHEVIPDHPPKAKVPPAPEPTAPPPVEPPAT